MIPANSRPVAVVVLFHGLDAPHLERFETHLGPAILAGKLSIWHHGKLLPGENVEKRIGEQIGQANLILLFVSAEFNAHYFSRITSVLEQTSTARIVPVAVRPCNWEGLPFYGLKTIPADNEPIVRHPDDEGRFQKAAAEIVSLVDAIQRQGDNLTATVNSPQAIMTLAAVERELYMMSRELDTLQAIAVSRVIGTATNAALSREEIEAADLAQHLIQRLRSALGMASTRLTPDMILFTLLQAVELLEQQQAKHGPGRALGISTKTIAIGLAALILGALTVMFFIVLFSRPQ